MDKSENEIKVRLIDIEGIHGLIESMTQVADKATKVVEAWDGPGSDDDVYPSIVALKSALIALNDYVDEHLDDE